MLRVDCFHESELELVDHLNSRYYEEAEPLIFWRGSTVSLMSALYN